LLPLCLLLVLDLAFVGLLLPTFPLFLLLLLLPFCFCCQLLFTSTAEEMLAAIVFAAGRRPWIRRPDLLPKGLKRN
jgi:hypothetical protein